MKKLSRTTWGIILVILAIGALFYFLKLRISAPSSDIDFTPGETVAIAVPDSIPEQPKNIILFIADGMGFGHLSLAQLTQQDSITPSVWDQFEVKGWHDARTTYGPLTDSGASATAMATGTPTWFGVIGMDDKGNVVENVFEQAEKQGYASGIVTDSYFWDATPAAFTAHTQSRDNSRDIMEQIAAGNLDVLFGELEDVGEEGNPEEDETYEILQRRFTLLDHSLAIPDDAIGRPIAAIFEEDEINDLQDDPNLPKMTKTALETLNTTGQPFILMVESEEMDSASHSNDSDRVVKGLQAIQETLGLLMDFATSDGETLLVFTADHETGGLTVVSDKNYPNLQMRWSTREHTAAVVPLYAQGPGARHFAGVTRNWQIGKVLKDLVQGLELTSIKANNE